MKQVLKQIVAALLTAEARILLTRKKPRIVAITGSVGKTGVKDAIYAALKARRRVRKSEKSFNSELGVPLSILGLRNGWSNPFSWFRNLFEGLCIALFSREYPEWLVLEAGVDRRGDMVALARWLRCDIVVLTRFPEVPVHVEFFGSAEEVIREKLHLLFALRPDGTLVYNNDDERVWEAAQSVRQKTLGFSRYSLSDFTASADTVVYEQGKPVGMECTLTHGGESARVQVCGSLGIQHAYHAAAAAAVSSLAGISLADAAAALCEQEPPKGRMRLIAGLKETFIIDDTYNASPVALQQALRTLKEIQTTGRKIAVLGDMLELGQFSVQAHEAAGAQIAESADALITVGTRARGFAAGARASGMPEERIFQHDNALAAGNELEAMLRPGDIVLVKGSQGMRMERIVEEVMAHPEDAPALLVRQNKEWRER